MLAAAAMLHDVSVVYKGIRFFYFRFGMKMGNKHLHHCLHAVSFVTTSFSLVHTLLQYRVCLVIGRDRESTSICLISGVMVRHLTTHVYLKILTEGFCVGEIDDTSPAIRLFTTQSVMGLPLSCTSSIHMTMFHQNEQDDNTVSLVCSIFNFNHLYFAECQT